MPFKINRPATFINRLLTMFGGESPAALEDNLRGVVDLTDFYGGPKLLTSGTANSTGAFPRATQLVLTAPLAIRGVGASIIIGAAPATNLSLCVGVKFPSGGPEVCLASQFFAQVPAAGIVQVGAPIPGRFVVEPGAAVYARVEATAAGADHALSAISVIEFYTNT